MAKKSILKVVQRKMTTDEFAKIANVTPKTVQRYCRKIVDDNDFRTLKTLREWGLVAVERLPDKTWSLRVKVKEKK